MSDVKRMSMKELFRKSLDGEFGHDVKVNNVVRLIPMAEAEAAAVERYITDGDDYFKAHPKDPDLLGFQKDGREWKALAAEGREFLKSEGLLAYDEQPKHIWCGTCGKALKGYKCPAGHVQHDIKGRVVNA